FNALAQPDKFADVAAALGEPVSGLGPREAAMRAVKAVRELAEDVGLPQRLREVGVRAEDLDLLTDGAVLQTRLLSNNPRALTREEIREIYARAL
ncbi:MAG: iron-containing alcohol dehydrogenase, partial [Firmicutes bacterium]|nr:iron-containing alcohol dehydrogenase [Bacillota bacterium]